MPASMAEDIVIGGVSIPPGKRKRVGIQIAKLYDYTEMTIPVEVVRGKMDGPVLFVSAAIHGDEINGTEAIKRLLARRTVLSAIRGTLIAVPIVNVFGFHQNTRYLPDRRDLNRCFPGSMLGSLGGQIAHIFMTEIVEKCTHGIDLHTGPIHRTNLPQIRASTDDPETKHLALAFGVPVVLNSNLRDGSLRQAATDKSICMLLFEGGEALRYEEKVIRSAIRGIISIMNAIGMVDQKKINFRKRKKEVFIARSSHWIRAPHSGSLRVAKGLGARVKKEETLGVISDTFGQGKIKVRARVTGIVIGINNLPLVNSGDALFHIATFEDSKVVEERVEFFDEMLE
ncbi:MAG: succinylglutamate desuccinylase/aspartoacylase family protein [Candidatus Scalindua rubra]|uniref:Aspartoacylase n=1 Tax=Candidatus Scalindua brodae TaxID=237368 RepID=A0A0B0EEI1_9BACT|nr:MAG: aspartoacylase [Candidatus Scalindua brodae]MBZ0109155.1 succinylglutamate desuccinylase/aspartoacylase family protein [Candidatus Scalindua rubra]TWU33592.1 aspartoacylase [Candidatus Brocadiaceae bacterium S225]